MNDDTAVFEMVQAILANIIRSEMVQRGIDPYLNPNFFTWEVVRLHLIMNEIIEKHNGKFFYENYIKGWDEKNLKLTIILEASNSDLAARDGYTNVGSFVHDKSEDEIREFLRKANLDEKSIEQMIEDIKKGKTNTDE
jgi:hypothetical protein